MSEIKTSVDKVSFSFGLVAGIALVSLIMLVAGGFPGSGKVAGEVAKDNQPTAAPTQPSQPAAPAPVTVDSGVTIQELTAPDASSAKVTLVEYSDFECPFCLRHQETLKRVAQTYGRDVYVEYKHFPLNSIHPQAQKAAEASECAGEQGKFWEMHDIIFEANAAQSMSVSRWKEVAGTLGLNTAQFNTCLDSGTYADKVNQQAAEGAAAGVQGTPATFVNGQLVSGAVPYEQLKQVIEANL